MSNAASAVGRQGKPTAGTPPAIPIFRAVWLASLASNIGIWLGNVGTAWLMTGLQPTPVMVTLVQASARLPVFLFARPAGAIAFLLAARGGCRAEWTAVPVLLLAGNGLGLGRPTIVKAAIWFCRAAAACGYLKFGMTSVM